MNPLLEKYLTMRQYRTIIKYWKIIENVKKHIEKLNLPEYCNSDNSIANINYYYNPFSDDRDSIISGIHYIGTLDYFEKEYIQYIHKIGYKLSDQSQDECLFQLLNNGLLL